MKMDSKMVFVFLLFMVAIVHNAWSQSTANAADEENHVEPTDRLTVVLGDDDVNGGDQHAAESADDPQHDHEHDHDHEHEHEHGPAAAATTETATVTRASALKKGDRSGRQLYQPFAYQPAPAFAQRRAYRGPKKRPPPRNKAGGRRPKPRGRRRPSGPPPPPSAGRYRRLPGPVRQQQVNYIDAAPPLDYYDDADVYEQAGPQTQPAAGPYADYVEQREFDRDPGAYAVVPSPVHAVTGRSRKRPAVGGYADEPQVVHVPVLRVIRPAVVVPTAAAAPPATTTADPMEKLRQLVHEAMDAHFANRHQDLYAADGTFDNKQQQRQHVYSAKYKRQPAAGDKESRADAADKPTAAPAAKGHKDVVLQYVSYATPPPPAERDAPAAADVDADADGSDDRLTLAEISAYMGAKPAETVLSAGGHRYVLSDALQQTYRHHQQQQQQQPRQEQQLQLQYNGDGHHRGYLRYVSPFEAMYELPAARWAYK